MIRVTLNSSDQRWATGVGEERLRTAIGKPKWAYKDGRSGVSTHIVGAMGELALCRALGIEWPHYVGVGRHMPDAHPFWEIRWSGRPLMPVKPDDQVDQMVALVRGKIPTFEIVGYALAGWAQRTKAAEDPGARKRKAHFVPDYQLVPLDPDSHAACHFLRAVLEDVTIPANKFFPERKGRRWRMDDAGEWICAMCAAPTPRLTSE